jgi:hypothetical protein
MTKFFFLLSCSVLSASTFAQDRQHEFFIVGNTNLYLPGNGSENGIYPILWYDKTTKPKVLIGGFGVGVSIFRSLSENFSLKGQANFSKNTYWDEPMELRGYMNEPLGHFQYGSSDFSLGINGTVHYFLSDKMSVGTGFGARLFTLTLSRIPAFENSGLFAGDISINHYNKTILPVIPIEWSLKGEKLLFDIRYEYGLSNRYKAELAKYTTDRFSVLYFEVGFRLR